MQLNSARKPKIIVIVGPTASGKSGLAIRLAQKLNSEIISADSRQVYKGMDLGTGKVTKKEQRLAPHHLLDISSPKKVFTASGFKILGQKAIQKILSKNKVPIIVGGTGFYIDALVYNLDLPDVPPNPKLRAKLEKQTAEQLFSILKKKDPVRANNIDRHNKRRLIRALEIIASTKSPIPAIKKQSPYQALWLGIKPPKDLDKKIKKRLDQRLKLGMIKEVKKLHTQGVSWKHLYDFGLEYRWVSEFLQNHITRQEMQNGLYQAILKYSKRQMTWFKTHKEIRWIKNYNEAAKSIKRFTN